MQVCRERSHQALTGSTGALLGEKEAGYWVKNPPNFSFAKGLGPEPRGQKVLLPCVAKKRSIGGDGAWREEEKRVSQVFNSGG